MRLVSQSNPSRSVSWLVRFCRSVSRSDRIWFVNLTIGSKHQSNRSRTIGRSVSRSVRSTSRLVLSIGRSVGLDLAEFVDQSVSRSILSIYRSSVSPSVGQSVSRSVIYCLSIVFIFRAMIRGIWHKNGIPEFYGSVHVLT